MMEARTGSFDKDEAPMTECRPYENQKSQFLKNEKSGLWELQIFNSDRLLGIFLVKDRSIASTCPSFSTSIA